VLEGMIPVACYPQRKVYANAGEVPMSVAAASLASFFALCQIQPCSSNLVHDFPVHTPDLPTSPLPELRVFELAAGSESRLQRFFEENPLYFESVDGEPPQPTEAFEEIHGALPAGWPNTK